VVAGKPLAVQRNDPGGNNMPAAFFIVRATVADPANAGHSTPGIRASMCRMP